MLNHCDTTNGQAKTSNVVPLVLISGKPVLQKRLSSNVVRTMCVSSFRFFPDVFGLGPNFALVFRNRDENRNPKTGLKAEICIRDGITSEP